MSKQVMRTIIIPVADSVCQKLRRAASRDNSAEGGLAAVSAEIVRIFQFDVFQPIHLIEQADQETAAQDAS